MEWESWVGAPNRAMSVLGAQIEVELDVMIPFLKLLSAAWALWPWPVPFQYALRQNCLYT